MLWTIIAHMSEELLDLTSRPVHPVVGKYLRNAVLPAIANFVSLIAVNSLTPYSNWADVLNRMVVGLTQLFDKSANGKDVSAAAICLRVLNDSKILSNPAHNMNINIPVSCLPERPEAVAVGVAIIFVPFHVWLAAASCLQSHVLAWIEERALMTPAGFKKEGGSDPVPVPAPAASSSSRYRADELSAMASRPKDDAFVSARFSEYVERIAVDHRVLSAIEDEFGSLVLQYRNIRTVSLAAFQSYSVKFESVVVSLIHLLDDSQLPEEIALLGIKVLRRLIEQENTQCDTPAADWLEEDWSDCQEAVVGMQNRLADLGVVHLICSMLGSVRPCSGLVRRLLNGASMFCGLCVRACFPVEQPRRCAGGAASCGRAVDWRQRASTKGLLCCDA